MNVDNTGRLVGVGANAMNMGSNVFSGINGVTQQYAGLTSGMVQQASQHISAASQIAASMSLPKITPSFQSLHQFSIVDTWAKLFKIVAWTMEQTKGSYDITFDLQDDVRNDKMNFYINSSDIEMMAKVRFQFTDAVDATNFKTWWG